MDLKTEEIYESRVYNVRLEALLEMLHDEIAAQPDVTPTLVALAVAADGFDVSMRITAKRQLSDGLISFAHVGVIGLRRNLIDSQALVPVERYQAYVRAFELGALDGGLVEEPTVIDLEGWRAYAQQNRNQP